MYKWWIYAVPRWHCVALGCKDSYGTSCMPFSQTLCLYWPLRSVKKTRAKNSFWFHMVWSISDAQHSILLPNETLSNPFLCETAAVISDFRSVEHQTRFQGLCKYIRHSAQLSPVILGTTLHNRFPKQYNLKKQWLPCPKDSWHLPGDGTHHFFHSLRTWNAHVFFLENKLSGHKSNHLKTLNLRCKTLMLHVLYIHLPWLLSSARFKLINAQFHHVHLFFEMFIWLCGWQNHCKTHDIPKPIRISKASGRQHLKSLWGHSGGSQWPEIFANGVYRIPRHHGSGFRQLFSNKCCCKQNL